MARYLSLLTYFLICSSSPICFATSAPSVWCGEIITFDSPEGFEQLVLEHHPKYFDSAKSSTFKERAEPHMRYSFDGPVHKIVQTSESSAKNYYRFEPEIRNISWNGHDVEVAVLNTNEKSPWEEIWAGVLLGNKAVLINEEMNSIILCKQYHSGESFSNVDSFLSALPGKIDDLIFQIRPILEHQGGLCENLLRGLELPPEEIE